MKGDPVPDQDHVIRYVGGTLVHDGQVEGNAFVRKPGEESPSVNWLEFFGGESVDDQVEEVRRHVRINRGATAVFARLNAGQTRTVILEETDGLAVAFVHDPQEPDPPRHVLPDGSHALIEGLPPPDETGYAEAIGDLICGMIIDTHPARAE